MKRAVGAVLTGLLAVAAAPAAASPNPSIKFSSPPPRVVRIGQSVLIRGRAHAVPEGAAAVLQVKRGARWTRLAHATVGRHGAVTIHWTVAKGTALGPISLRLAVGRRGRLFAASAADPSAIGSAYVPCAPPSPPGPIPRGDGWITGGVYGEGGAFPGIDACLSRQYTIEAVGPGGSVAAREKVPGGHSYTLVVPAGTYALSSDGCRGHATVRAGKHTKANTFCLYP